jgi:kynureninase
VWDGFARIRDLVASRQYEKIKTTDSRVTWAIPISIQL